MPIYTDSYPYDAPEGAIELVKKQYHRWKIQIPRSEILDKGICFVIEYVGMNSFFAMSADIEEFRDNPEHLKWVIEELMGPVEALIKTDFHIQSTNGRNGSMNEINIRSRKQEFMWK